jgi:hypothetical protein
MIDTGSGAATWLISVLASGSILVIWGLTIVHAWRRRRFGWAVLMFFFPIFVVLYWIVRPAERHLPPRPA